MQIKHFARNERPSSTTAKLFARNCLWEIRMAVHVGCSCMILLNSHTFLAFLVSKTDFYRLLTGEAKCFPCAERIR